MVRKKAIKSRSFLDSSVDQHKNFDDRLNLIEATLEDTSSSIQEIKEWIAENKESTVDRKDPKQGFLRDTFNIDKFPKGENSLLESKRIVVAGATWYLSVRKKKEGEELVLGAYLHFKPGSSGISYNTDYTIRFVGSTENIENQANRCFDDEKLGHGFIMAAWTRLTNFTNGFVDEKGNFEVQIIFSVMGKTNAAVLLDAEFLSSGFVKSDCILLVENRQFPVNKGLLSLFSSYFKTLFFGDFREQNQDEIELKDVCAKEFLHLLRATYLSVNIESGNEDVIRNNVECLLRLADFYQVEIVTKRCEMHLRKCPVSEVALEEKVLYAQDYQLPELLDQCIKAFKTVDDVKKLRKTSQYSRLTKENKILIFENIT